ncbi:DUF4394 domain-containing protein [Aquabacterium sp. G14]|uniref:DUF4394 domain-containing protein n=1 Tax=Aquabacterium sp. G14 TaxID=3130164 RepID=UPI0030AA048D
MQHRFSLSLAATLLALSFGAQADMRRDTPPLSCASGTAGTLAGKKGSADDKLDVVALTADSRLVCFNEHKPSKARLIGMVNGLQGDTRLVGIDFRVQDGLLYGVGDAGGVYTLSTVNAAAALVNRLSVPLSGTTFGVDFNPAADRLRIVSDAGQNLRHNVNANGVTLADGTLNYTAGTPAQGIVAAAYTNNDLSPATPPTTGTTLFVLDATQDQVVLQSPPNAGSLMATGKLTVDASSTTGFDIYSVLRDGITVSNRALATMHAADGSVALYSVDVLTGKAQPRGKLASDLSVVDIAVPLSQH